MDLLEILKRGQHKVLELMHGGIKQENIEMIVLDDLCEEILQELGEIEKYDEVKKALMNMFFFGQLTKTK
jgi:hypothetical protein